MFAHKLCSFVEIKVVMIKAVFDVGGKLLNNVYYCSPTFRLLFFLGGGE